MNFAYYPGCSARSTCAELNEAMHEVAARLGLALTELESATCTGARELRAIDPAGFHTLNVRILALAEREGLPLMTVCNTCTLNLLDAHAAFVDDPVLADEVNGRLAAEGLRYGGRAPGGPPPSGPSPDICTPRPPATGQPPPPRPARRPPPP